MAKHGAGYERLGAKVLSLPDVIAQSVGFMGPVFSSAFVIPLVVGVVSASGKGGGVASPISVLFALPNTPLYFSLFAWGSTFGGFALVVVYLLMAVGSLRNFAGAPGSSRPGGSSGRARLAVSAVIAILITAGAIVGSFYKVTSPTIYAPWLALAVLVIGFGSTFVTRARRPASSELSDLTKSTA
jgi:hypothetical protein